MTSMKRLKSPCRYPGGKTRALPRLFENFPDLNNYTHFREPFLGGGSVAIHATKTYPHLNVWVNDLYVPLYTFWVQLRDNGNELADYITEKRLKADTIDKTKELFMQSQDSIYTGENDLVKGASYWISNKCSFSGITEGGYFSESASVGAFTLNNISNLKEYHKIVKNWKITNLSYEELLTPSEEKTFVYLDPPYEISSVLYGKKGSMHKGFDHDLFAQRCNDCNLDMAISYNDVDSVRDRFSDDRWNKVVFPLTYSMAVNSKTFLQNQHKRNELLLINYK